MFLMNPASTVITSMMKRLKFVFLLGGAFWVGHMHYHGMFVLPYGVICRLCSMTAVKPRHVLYFCR